MKEQFSLTYGEEAFFCPAVFLCTLESCVSRFGSFGSGEVNTARLILQEFCYTNYKQLP